ncbi:uncharacterized protein LOC112590242 [Harpegnathos saltator]|uniref:uncharacterized protein LOC112590242 n=1 Tax=Harpegnathos saltator TaxID=610380 RepID=UPI000DBEEB70|nr:uncharacterized protein LOC112590242 [Harpegnathos saltator]
MEEYKITQEMKRHAVIIAICAKHTDLEISNFLNCARSFVHKVRRELEASASDVETVAKRKKHEERSDTTKNTQFVQQVQEIVDESPSKSMRAIARDLNVSESLIRRVVYEDLRYTSNVMRRGQFMSAQTREQRLIRGKRLLNKLKHPEVPNMLWFLSDEKNFDQDQKINQRNDRSCEQRRTCYATPFFSSGASGECCRLHRGFRNSCETLD